MGRFLLKIFLFAIIVISIIFGAAKILSLKNENKSFANYDTDDNLYTIKRNEHFDFLIMGISHARNFTRHKNHLRVEKILNKKFINLGRGGGKCGPAAEYAYLQHFFSRGNKTDYVLYVPTPPMMFSDYLNVNSSIFEMEPFRVNFFFQYLFSEGKNKKQQLYYYITSKFKPQWENLKSVSMDSVGWHLEKYDTAAINLGFKQAYPNGLDSITFERNKLIVKKTIELCLKNNSKVIFMMTPSMFGAWPGHEQVFDYLNEIQLKYPIEIYDYSEVCKDSTLYFDHHHFNSKGVSWFTEVYINKILAN